MMAQEADAQRELRVLWRRRARRSRETVGRGGASAEIKRTLILKVLEAHQRNERVLLQHGALFKLMSRGCSRPVAFAEELQQWRLASMTR